MRIKPLTSIITSLFLLSLCGCGGGGSSTTVTAGVPSTPQSSTGTAVSGVVSKGIIKNGKVKIFSVSGDVGNKVLLAVATTNGKGEYTASIGAYSGPLLIEASGEYSDEATGATKTITEEAPLRAAVAAATGTVQIAITPLTELAVQKAGATLTAKSITEANTLVSDLYRIDIITTQPVEPSLQAFQNPDTTQVQKDYTLALAAVSQLVKNSAGASLSVVLESLRSELAVDNRISTQTAAAFKSALTTFLSDTSVNRTGITDINATGLTDVGSVTYVVKLHTRGTFAAGSFIKGIQLSVKLPAGVTVKADASGKTTAGTVAASGVAASGSSIDTNYVGTSNLLYVAMLNGQGFGTGEFITIMCDIAPGFSPPAGSFDISDVSAKGAEGVPITGITVFPTY
ncbi:MAG: hypothetical protein FD174_1088 [Geobacteraceae bacterium]|nr:MAG: hypothetical protein FD174_1088 [Geobacteraceae bacterium]